MIVRLAFQCFSHTTREGTGLSSNLREMVVCVGIGVKVCVSVLRRMVVCVIEVEGGDGVCWCS